MTKRLYSPSTKTTYIEGYHTDIPADAIPISDARYLEVIANPSPGKVRGHDAEGLPILVDPPAPARAVVELTAWERIKAERERRTLSGGARVGDHWFHTDQLSRDQQIKLMLAGEDVPRIGWKSMSGEYVQMTPELARAIVEAVVAADIAIFAAADAHRGAMLASDDPAAYDFSHGWPLTFDEWQAQQEA